MVLFRRRATSAGTYSSAIPAAAVPASYLVPLYIVKCSRHRPLVKSSRTVGICILIVDLQYSPVCGELGAARSRSAHRTISTHRLSVDLYRRSWSYSMWRAPHAGGAGFFFVVWCRSTSAFSCSVFCEYFWVFLIAILAGESRCDKRTFCSS